MTWILLALLASLFWAGTNIFDKYALSKITRGSYDFLFFGSIGSFFLFTLTFFVFGVENTGIIALLPILLFFGPLVLSLEKLSLNIFKYRKAALLMIPAIILVSFYTLLINESLDLLS